MIGDSGRLQYLRFCLFEMYINGFFVIRCLYSAMSLTLVREQRFIRIIYYYYYVCVCVCVCVCACVCVCVSVLQQGCQPTRTIRVCSQQPTPVPKACVGSDGSTDWMTDYVPSLYCLFFFFFSADILDSLPSQTYAVCVWGVGGGVGVCVGVNACLDARV